jgi:hypothetical protein
MTHVYKTLARRRTMVDHMCAFCCDDHRDSMRARLNKKNAEIIQLRKEWDEYADAIRAIHEAAFADDFDVTRLNDAILGAGQLALVSREPSRG